jgi:hypothetical protein
LLLRQTLASAQISRTNTMTADTIQKIEKSMLDFLTVKPQQRRR